MIILSILLMSSFLIMPPEASKQKVNVVPPMIVFDDMNNSEYEILDVHFEELVRKCSFYMYDIRKWKYEAMRCPFKKHLIIKGEDILNIPPSKIVAIIPPDSSEIKIIPLWHHAIRVFGDPYRDPHNWAFFSEMIENESLKIDKDDDWLQLAACFKVEYSETLIRVGYFNINRNQKTFSKWSFEFNTKGWLKEVAKESFTESDLLSLGSELPKSDSPIGDGTE